MAVAASPLQADVLRIFRSGANVIVKAVAGAGKTTVFMMIAQSAPEKTFLMLTYNARLRKEVRLKVAHWGLANVEVHTYHSFCRKYYVSDGYTDKIIRTAVACDVRPRQKVAYDVLLLDEQQDCTLWYYWMTRKVIRDSPEAPQLVLCGDPRQCVFEFNSADSRFLTLGSELYSVGEGEEQREWSVRPLDVSHRIPGAHAAFVDACMLGGRGEICSVKPGRKPQYLVCNVFCPDAVLSIIQGWLGAGCKPDDIMILAPSLRSSNPVMRLEGALKEAGIDCYVPIGDDREPSETAMVNKVCFGTFHQSKGRERRCVVVYGFDATYFTYFEKQKDAKQCPNTMYVAATRALEQMLLVQDCSSAPLPFLDMDLLSEHADVVVASDDDATKSSSPQPKLLRWSVTELLRHLPSDLVDEILDGYEAHMQQVSAPDEHEGAPRVGSEHGSTVEGSTEEVSDINGNVATTLFDLHRRRLDDGFLCTTFTNVRDLLYGAYFRFPHVRNRLESVWEKYVCGSHEDLTLNDVVFMCTVFTDQRYVSRTLQLQGFDWWDDANKDYVLDCFEEYGVDDDAAHEVLASAAFPGTNIKIDGRYDLCGSTRLTEVKYVAELQPVHKLQLLVYAWMYGQNNGLEAAGRMSFDLLNTRTRECWRMRYSPVPLEDAVRRILACKTNQSRECAPDAEFVRAALAGGRRHLLLT